MNASRSSGLVKKQRHRYRGLGHAEYGRHAGQNDDRRRWAEFMNPIHQGQPVHVRHPHVGDDRVKI